MSMKKQKTGSVPIFLRMMTWIVVCWLILLSVTMMVTMRYAIQTFQNKVDEILISTVESLRSTPTVRDMILSGVCPPDMEEYLDGVIGYTNDEVRRRSKEIAIRKVNGAEVGHILQMLCRDVAIIALPAVVIGVLLSWQIGNVWVSSNFKDILSISPLVYIGVVIVSLAFILGTVIVKSWRVANENPVVSIKSE